MKIAVLGSTGSIGTQTLDVARALNLEIAALTAHSNIDLLGSQIAEFKPKLAAVHDKAAARELAGRVGAACEVLAGPDGIIHAAGEGGADVVVNALVGSAGLLPTIAAIKAGRDVALANKETLVCAGELIMPMAREKGVQILPVDSEHSAIFQCLQASGGNSPRKIYLTASGGPFRGYSAARLATVSVNDALAHPNWAMGRKVTIDSATMMNKGLEMIEAAWLFGLAAGQIEVLVHPQSIIHSMVEFADGQILAQLGPPDMRLPIQYALTHPRRLTGLHSRLDFTKTRNLTFETPDFVAFPCLGLAYEAFAAGGLIPCVLNAANEEAVRMFLAEEIAFTDIPRIIDCTISAYNENNQLDIDGILQAEKWARQTARNMKKRCVK